MKSLGPLQPSTYLQEKFWGQDLTQVPESNNLPQCLSLQPHRSFPLELCALYLDPAVQSTI
jgi:hypothetical protein